MPTYIARVDLTYTLVKVATFVVDADDEDAARTAAEEIINRDPDVLDFVTNEYRLDEASIEIEPDDGSIPPEPRFIGSGYDVDGNHFLRVSDGTCFLFRGGRLSEMITWDQLRV